MINSANPNSGAELHTLGWPDGRRMVSCLVIDHLGFFTSVLFANDFANNAGYPRGAGGETYDFRPDWQAEDALLGGSVPGSASVFNRR
jgi:hypothetical protein